MKRRLVPCGDATCLCCGHHRHVGVSWPPRSCRGLGSGVIGISIAYRFVPSRPDSFGRPRAEPASAQCLKHQPMRGSADPTAIL